MLLKEAKILNNGVAANWSEVVKTEMDYNNKSSKATVYYYLDEQHAIDSPQETVFAEVIEVPYVEQEELEKSGVTAKVKAEEAMVAKIEAKVEEKPVEEPITGLPVEEVNIK